MDINNSFRCIDAFEKWLNKIKKKINLFFDILLTIRKFLTLKLGSFKSIRDGIIELKVKATGYRLYCVEVAKDKFVFLCGGDKKTQDDDVKKAIQLKNDGLDECNCCELTYS